MCTRDPGASFDTPNVVIGRQGRNELTLSFRPDPYLATLLGKSIRPERLLVFGKIKKVVSAGLDYKRPILGVLPRPVYKHRRS